MTKTKRKIKLRRSSRVVMRRATGLGRQIDQVIEENKEAEVKIKEDTDWNELAVDTLRTTPENITT